MNNVVISPRPPRPIKPCWPPIRATVTAYTISLCCLRGRETVAGRERRWAGCSSLIPRMPMPGTSPGGWRRRTTSSLKPHYAEAHYNLGVFYELHRKDLPKALVQYHKYLNLGGRDDRVERIVGTSGR